MIEIYGAAHDKTLFTDCISIGDLAAETERVPDSDKWGNEVFTSIYTNAHFQAEQYCKAVQNHTVFNQSDFNIIGIS